MLDAARTAIVVIDLQKGVVGHATQPHTAARRVPEEYQVSHSIHCGEPYGQEATPSQLLPMKIA